MDDDIFLKLEGVCLEVLKVLRTFQELQTDGIAVIGGLALCKHLPHGSRTPTQDIDFCLTAAEAPDGVKAKLLALSNSPFQKCADVFGYGTDQNFVQVDLVNAEMLPYIPTAAIALNELTADSISYISEIDLLVYKIYSCGFRAKDKREKDADGVHKLLSVLSPELPLNPLQRKCISDGLMDVVNNGTHGKDEAWWKARLGLQSAR